MGKLSWGKPRIWVKDLSASTPKWEEEFTPVEDSTTLDAAEGDKLEAKLEGGGVEDVKQKKSTFTFSYQIRMNSDRKNSDGTPKFIIKDTNGVVTANYAVMLQPEDPAGIGFEIASASVSVSPSFSTQEGAMKTFTFNVLDNPSGDDVAFKVITAPVVG